MTLLILGLIVFFSIHFIPATPIRAAIVGRTGEQGYQGIFSLVALTGFGLIVYGFSQTEHVAFIDPQTWGRSAAYVAMPIVVILLIAANAPSNIKRLVRHPMLIGITLWSGVHLAANGDLASTLIFVSFGVFSILDILLVELGGRAKRAEPVSWVWDFGIVVGGLALFVVLFYFHGSYTGMPLM